MHILGIEIMSSRELRANLEEMRDELRSEG